MAMQRSWPLSVVGLILAGLGLIVAPFLSFITATAALIGTLSRTGVELIGPEVFVLCLLGGVLVAIGYERSAGGRQGRAIVIIPGLMAFGLSLWYFVQVNDRVNSVASVGVASIGTGMWLALAASVVALAVGVFVRPAEAIPTPPATAPQDAA